MPELSDVSDEAPRVSVPAGCEKVLQLQSIAARELSLSSQLTASRAVCPPVLAGRQQTLAVAARDINNNIQGTIQVT